MTVDFSLKPYYDDFAESKRFLKILFKPGYAIQTRELNQLQSILQNQIKKFGDHIFKNGTNVYGGKFHYYTSTKMFKVTSVITQSDWVEDTIITNGTLDAKIITKVVLPDGQYIVVEYLSGNSKFNIGNSLSIKDSVTNNETIVLDNELATCSVFTVDSGIFYVNGYFVYADKQTIYIGTDTKPSVLLGFTVIESIITTDEDESLFDNAADSTNYSAPGADRYHMELKLAQYDYYTEDLPADFIKLYGIERGDLKINKDKTEYNELEKMLARRTFDESGNYILDTFNAQIIEHNGNVLSGSLTANYGSKAITGVNTKFLTELRPDSKLLLGGYMYEVESVTDDLNCSLTENYIGTGQYSSSSVLVKNNDQFTVKLDVGKAYVQGHEIETYSPTYITLNKGKLPTLVTNSTYFNYGNYLYVNTLTGSLDVQNLDQVELHNTEDSPSATTVIGTAICTNLEYVATDLYRFSLGDVEFNVVSSTTSGDSTGITTIKLAADAGTVNDMYVGADIKAEFLAADTDLNIRTIVAYDGTTKLATVDVPFSAPVPNGTDYEILWGIGAVKQLVTDRGTGTESTAIIDSKSKQLKSTIDNSLSFYTTFISEPDTKKTDTFIARIGQQNVVPLLPTEENKVPSSLGQFSYYFNESFVNVTWTATGNATEHSWTTTLTDANSTFVGPAGSFTITGDSIDENFTVVKAAGQVTLTSAIVSNSGKTITLYTATNPGTTTIIAKCFTNSTKAKYRRLMKPILTDGIPAAGNPLTVGDVTLYRDNSNKPTGVIKIANPNTVPGKSDSLLISQVYDLLGKFKELYGQFESEGKKVMYKVIDSDNPADFGNDSYDITFSYKLDDGQKNNYYDHAKLILLPHRRVPRSGNIMVMVTYFYDDATAGDPDGYYSVDSYMWDLGTGTTTYRDAYNMIPVYTAKDGLKVPLRDCLDFRPARQNGTTAFVMNNSKIPLSDQALGLTYSYYNGRVDKVVLTETGSFKVYEGVPSLIPSVPTHQGNELPLYNIMIPSWTYFIEDIAVQPHNAKRYTMRDIGELEQRIEHLEYYTSLSILEKEVKNMSIKDEQTGLEMFKSGFVVDSFGSHKLVDYDHGDCQNLFSIDLSLGELRPSFKVYNQQLIAVGVNEDYIFSHDDGEKFTLAYTEEAFITQGEPTHAFNVNSINTGVYVGTTNIFPETDIWVDTQVETTPVSVDLASDQTGWTGPVSLGTVWNSWETNIVGSSKQFSSTFLDAGDYSSLSNSISTVASEAAASIASSNAAISSLNSNINTVTAEIGKINNSIASKDKTMTQLNGDTVQVTSEVTTTSPGLATTTPSGVVANVASNTVSTAQAKKAAAAAAKAAKAAAAAETKKAKQAAAAAVKAAKVKAAADVKAAKAAAAALVKAAKAGKSGK